MDKKIKNALIRLAAALALLCLAGLAVLAAVKNPGLVTGAYNAFSRKVCGCLGAVFSVFPFSFAEFALMSLILAAVVTLGLLLFRWGRKNGWRAYLGWFSYAALIACSGFAFFIFCWGLNYFGPSLADTLGLEAVPTTHEALFETAEYYLAQTNAWSVLVGRKDDGTCDLGGFSDLAERCPSAYKALAAENPRFEGIYSPPKPVTCWKLMSYTQITGIYCPFTGECNVNPDSAPASLPFTMLHEMAHRLGVCPENEANFTAFLACRASGMVEFEYSGYYSAFVYLYNAVTKIDADEQSELWNGLSDGALADTWAAIEHYRKYEGKTSEVAESVNDFYLKTMRQESGVESYGEVADLLIADYLQNIKGKEGQ